MADNPYCGQGADCENAWDWGYKYGYDCPHVTDYPAVAATLDHYWPGPLYRDEQRSQLKYVWAEGALAGQQDGLHQGHPVSVSAAHTGSESEGAGAAIAHVGGHGAVEGGAYLAERTTLTEIGLVTEGVTVGGFFAAVGEGLAIGAILFLVTGGGLTFPEETHTDPDELGKFMAQKCTEAGCSQFFLPYCTATGHHDGGSDDIFNAGLWHGPLYYDQGNAFGEAQQHVINEHHWGHTGILHYLPAEPNYMEWMVLNHT